MAEIRKFCEVDSEDIERDTTPSKKAKTAFRKYSLELKLEVISEAKKSSNRQVASLKGTNH